MKESDYQRKITKYLEKEGAYVIKVIVGNKKGIPDIIACYKGHFIAVEVKTPKTMNNTSPLQEYNLRAINDKGGYAIVAHSVEQVERVLSMLDDI